MLGLDAVFRIEADIERLSVLRWKKLTKTVFKFFHIQPFIAEVA